MESGLVDSCHLAEMIEVHLNLAWLFECSNVSRFKDVDIMGPCQDDFSQYRSRQYHEAATLLVTSDSA